MRLEVGAEPGLDGLTESLALAGYERVERAEERGQFAVRGGLVDVFPTTGREPLRVELYGDEIEQVRAFSPFTQRALHTVDDAVVYPAAERKADLSEPTLADDEEPVRSAPEIPNDLVPRARARAGLRLAARRGAPRLGRGGPRRDLAEGHVRARSVPAVAGLLLRGPAARDRRARARGGRERAERLRPGRQPRRRRVPARGRGAAHREPAQARRLARPRRRPGPPRAAGAPLRRRAGPPRLRLARARARAAAGHAGLPQASAACRPAARPRAGVVRRPPQRRLHRPRGPRRRQAGRLRDEGGRGRHARLPLPRVPRRGPALRPARAARQGLEVHRRRRQLARALEARRQGVAEPEGARPRVACRSSRPS